MGSWTGISFGGPTSWEKEQVVKAAGPSKADLAEERLEADEVASGHAPGEVVKDAVKSLQVDPFREPADAGGALVDNGRVGEVMDSPATAADALFEVDFLEVETKSLVEEAHFVECLFPDEQRRARRYRRTPCTHATIRGPDGSGSGHRHAAGRHRLSGR